MKIAVIAANGRSGKVFVELALKNGHSVRAGVYHQSSLNEHESLTVVSCDATNIDDIKDLVADCDGVVSFIGHTKGSDDLVQTKAITNIVEALEASPSKRIVSLTGTGVRFAGDKPNLVDHILNISIKLIDPKRIKDGIMHAKVLKNSSLNWTLVRVLKLTNGNDKPFQLTEHGPAETLTSRQEVARAVLEVLENNSFVRVAPVVSKRC